MTLWMERRLAYMAHVNSALTGLTGLLPSISRILPVFIRLYAPVDGHPIAPMPGRKLEPAIGIEPISEKYKLYTLPLS